MLGNPTIAHLIQQLIACLEDRRAKRLVKAGRPKPFHFTVHELESYPVAFENAIHIRFKLRAAVPRQYCVRARII
jgi:hypothetical protein